jgi:hypothetical protein
MSLLKKSMQHSLMSVTHLKAMSTQNHQDDKEIS